MKILLVLLMGFAWSIGGEKYFGRWRRGVLVSIVSIGIGIVSGIPYWALGALIPMFYIYQALFYDMGIRMIWPGAGDKKNVLLGLLILFANGVICGAFPAVIKQSVVLVIFSGFAFIFICWLSNSLKWGWNGCYRISEVKVWCPQDTWWWACWIYGIILGALSI